MHNWWAARKVKMDTVQFDITTARNNSESTCEFNLIAVHFPPRISFTQIPFANSVNPYIVSPMDAVQHLQSVVVEK